MIIRNRKSIRVPGLGSVLLFGLLIGACSPTGTLIHGDSVPAGGTSRDNLILAGTDVTVEGDVEGDVFAAGRNITVDGDVGGNLYLAGETLAVNGEVGGNVYSTGVNLELREESSVAKSLYFAGVRLSTLPGSSIDWDLRTVSLGANLGGDVGGETRALIGVVELANILLEQVGTRFNLPNVPQLFPSNESSLPGAQTAGLSGSNVLGSTPGALVLAGIGLGAPSPPPQAGGIDTEALADLVVPRLKNLAVMIILGGLVLWLIPNRFLIWTDQGRQHPFASTGYGLVIAIVGYVGFGVVAVLLMALAVGFIVAGFWWEAMLFGLLAFSGLGLVSGTFLLFVYYGSKLIFSYLVAWLILSRFGSAGNRYRMLTLLLGLLIYEIIQLIPYAGIVAAVLVTFFGLGAAWLGFVKIRRGEISADLTPALFARPQLPPPAEPVETVEPAGGVS